MMANISAMMTMLVMTAVLIGAMLGLRFKVFILVPAISISSVAIFGIGIAHGSGIWSVLLAAFLAITALQIGYLAGATVHFGITRARVRKDASGIIAVPQRR